jgi:hypothetical protein
MKSRFFVNFNPRLLVVTGCGVARSGDNSRRTLTEVAAVSEAKVDGNLDSIQ